MTINKLPTVTLAFSALNEEKNIKAFLESVFMQIEDGFILKEILLISDGSTDNTVKIAKSFKSKKLIIKDYKERKGKSYRLNEIYKSLRTDILIQTDADVIYAHERVFYDLIQPILNNKKIGMVGGYSQAKEGKTFTEKAIVCSFNAYATLRTLNKSNSVTGVLLAYRKEFAKTISIPANMIGNDVYTYFLCITSGYKYTYVPSAVAYFRVSTTLKDQIKQNTRYEAVPERMTQYFPQELVEKEAYIPRTAFIRILLTQFLQHPILCTYIFFVNQYCRIKAKQMQSKLTGRWEVANSSKKL
jgi:glycosyltransferase involved in cell wall biosynthesis